MKIGLILPLFHDDARRARDAARDAVDMGVDGVFAYDHLWPMGSPHRPALAPFPVLADIAQRHPTLAVGPLVARIGLGSPEHLLDQFAALRATGATVIQGVGTGDSLSADENRGYGLSVSTPDQRRRELDDVVSELVRHGEVWVGGGGAKTNEIARRHGATVNLWELDAASLGHRALDGPVSWAGVAGVDLAAQIDAIEAAGATWAVFAPQTDRSALAAAISRRG